MPTTYLSPLNVGGMPMAKQKQNPFAKMVRSLAHKKNAPKNPKAVAAKIGMAKLGKKKFEAKAVAGRKKAARKKK